MRVARRYHVVRQVLGCRGARSDDRVLTHGDPSEDDRAAALVDVTCPIMPPAGVAWSSLLVSLTLAYILGMHI
ncbi:hypothetical protein Vqi01_12240 [Micromonospora qiuiae]|uniref:Uncharacterized protein n=1 Tax=Micromonospora qiuiae TaxID=502268 RepID=A0ABQ4J7A9_9ACTN|nr:hypothetical protein Vqi01_12240 [Micromonospora qiuiae]